MADQKNYEFVFPGVNQEDLDRNLALSNATLFKWFQSARMRLPWVGAGYTDFSKEEPAMMRRLVVKTQMVKMEPGKRAEAPNKVVTSKVTVGNIGGTSIEFRYDVLFDGVKAGTGCVLMIAVGGVPGSLKPSPVPTRVKGLGDPENVQTFKPFMLEMAGKVAKPKAGEPLPASSNDVFLHKVVVRHSDEDVNKHANHSAYARYFEDAREILIGQGKHPLAKEMVGDLDTVIIEYGAEATADDVCELRLTKGDGKGTVNVLMHKVGTGGDHSFAPCLPELLVSGSMICGNVVSGTDASRL